MPPCDLASADPGSVAEINAEPASSPDTFPIRAAVLGDAPELRSLIALSVRELQKDDYPAEQLALAVETVFTLDTQLVADGTYFVIEAPASEPPSTSPNGTQTGRIIACGGWSRRKTLCGGDRHAVRDNAFLEPATDAAKIRAFFVHPAWARRGLGSRLLAHCEQGAQGAGFSHFEMAATLTGVPLYLARGYHVVETATVPLCGDLEEAPGGTSVTVPNLPVVIMARSVLENAASNKSR